MELDTDAESEIIALLLGEEGAEHRNPRPFARGAQRLVRSPDGRISLEDVESEEAFHRAARTTGCFRRGTPIRCPESREVIGYELEEVRIRNAVPG